MSSKMLVINGVKDKNNILKLHILLLIIQRKLYILIINLINID